MSEGRPKESWHLDKRVPVALILTLLAYGGVALWWASGVEQRVVSLEVQQRETDAAIREVPSRLARLEVLLERIERQLAKPERD